ncbi:MAG TPA: hypothetical protein VM846_06245, partial [Vicinamibacterales bacterium]|nr:hypothetical protein [Vicinamibacterales bacterium]
MNLVVRSLCVIAILVVGAGLVAAQSQGRPNTWAARSSTGLTLAGTWTATEDAKTGTVTGTWTLIDAQSRVIARGVWSAAKSASAWNGNWRAAAEGRAGEYTGTWTAKPG